MTAPKAFLSHATEDKERFAVPLATALLGKGVDVWLDQWEIKAGDSLVKKVFTEGISEASVFIIVISPISIRKPWVSEELDAAVVQKLNSQTKIIPVVLDNAEVPAPLRHLLWVSVERYGFDGTVAQVVQSVFDLDTKPPLGPAPAYHATPSVRIVGDAQDDAVLAVAFDLWVEHGGEPVKGEIVTSKALEYGLTPDLVYESVLVLKSKGMISSSHIVGGDWSITGFPGSVTMAQFAGKGVDVEGLSRRLLATIVNEDNWRIREFEEAPFPLLRAVVDRLVTQGYIAGGWTFGGGFLVSWVSPLAARALR